MTTENTAFIKHLEWRQESHSLSDDWDYKNAVLGTPVPRKKQRTVVSVSLNAAEFDVISQKAKADKRKISQYLKLAALERHDNSDA